MAARTLVCSAILLFCLLCSSSIRGDAQHAVIENNSEGAQQSNKSTGNSTRGFLLGGASYGRTLFAGYQSKGSGGNTWWHGVRASIDVWNLKVQKLSRSASYISVINTHKPNAVEMISAGVHVDPQMHKNNDLRFFVYWKNDKGKGCYNTDCPGFVIANGTNLYPRQAFAPPFSQYGGVRRFVALRIKKDETTKDWSLYHEDNKGPIGGTTLLGWWPHGLFGNLSDRAHVIQWAGEADFLFNQPGPSMGSGHFPVEGVGKAAAFYDCSGFDYDGTRYNDLLNPIPFVDLPECYGISEWGNKAKPRNQHFFYGGPAGCAVQQ